MTKEEKNFLENTIQVEGFDYCMTDYSEWGEIEDREFQRLLKQFIEARQKLIEYLEDNEIL